MHAHVWLRPLCSVRVCVCVMPRPEIGGVRYHHRRSRGCNVITRTVEDPTGLPSAPHSDWVRPQTDFLTRWGLCVYRAETAEGHLKGGFNEALNSIRMTTS